LLLDDVEAIALLTRTYRKPYLAPGEVGGGVTIFPSSEGMSIRFLVEGFVALPHSCKAIPPSHVRWLFGRE
jgi:hypothetical protein